jgi:hypothetical protein
MTKHACPRCGLEGSHFKCDPSWADRHPAAAVLFALPTLYTLTGVILAYPWFFVPLSSWPRRSEWIGGSAGAPRSPPGLSGSTANS